MHAKSPWHSLSRREIYRRVKARLRRVARRGWRGTRAALDRTLRRILRNRSRAELLRIARQPIVAGLIVTGVLAHGSNVHADGIELSAIASNANPGGFALHGASAYGYSGIRVSNAGDVNGDGLDDVIVSAPYVSSNGMNSGTSYVVFGRPGGTAVQLSAIAQNANAGGFAIHGAAAGDTSGWSVSAAGDVNGDGLDDIIIGAWRASPDGKDRAGTSYVVFGKADGVAVMLSDIALDANAGGFALFGDAPDDQSGFRVSGAGDVNGDGLDDVIVGAWRASPGSKNRAGTSYVVFGKADGASLQLSEIASSANSGGFAIFGDMATDYSGYSVSGAGDVNGDGLDDVIIGAPGASVNGGGAGAAYIVFGKLDGGALQLADLAADDNDKGFALYGASSPDFAGGSVSGAGDMNGDGLADVIVGAKRANSSAGISYVVFGKSSGASIQLSDVAMDANSSGFAIHGASANDSSGTVVSGGGDVNGDGRSDIIVSAPNAGPNGDNSGTTYVVFGKPGGHAIQLADVAASEDGAGFAMHGAAEYDMSGYGMSIAGDVDGDGLSDVIVGAYGADLNGDYSGSSYVVFSPFGLGTVWADFAHAGQQTGKFNKPFSNLAGAIASVPSGGTIRIKGNTATSTSSETPTLSKPMTIHSSGGKVTIGSN